MMSDACSLILFMCNSCRTPMWMRGVPALHKIKAASRRRIPLLVLNLKNLLKPTNNNMKTDVNHDSDCAMHNEPHMPNGPCNCDTGMKQLVYDELLSRGNDNLAEPPRNVVHAILRGYTALRKKEEDNAGHSGRGERGITFLEALFDFVATPEGKRSEAQHGRAQLGVDGNCGFALLGTNLQEGEAEFVEIQPGREPDNALAAGLQALKALRHRLKLPELNYYFGPSHPYGN